MTGCQRHRDPFAGSLRYHLGLVNPNLERCLSVVDETFVDYAENKTGQTRLILFCDMERPLAKSAGAVRQSLHRPLNDPGGGNAERRG